MRPATIAITLSVLLVTTCAGAPGPDPAASAPQPPPAPSAPTQPTCDDWGKWAFFESASAQLVHECLQAGADPNGAPHHHQIIFLAARAATDPAVIGLLAGAGADPKAHPGRPGIGSTPLHVAAERNPTPGIIDALVAAGADTEARDLHGQTPLHAAWANPNPAVVRTLLRSGADPLASDHHDRFADPAGCHNWNTAAFARLALLADFERCLAGGARCGGLGRGGDERFGVLTACGRRTGNRGRGSAWRRGWQAGHPAIPPVRRTRRRTG